MNPNAIFCDLAQFGLAAEFHGDDNTADNPRQVFHQLDETRITNDQMQVHSASLMELQK